MGWDCAALHAPHAVERHKEPQIYRNGPANCLKNKASENAKARKKRDVIFAKRSGDVVENKEPVFKKCTKRTGKWHFSCTSLGMQLIENK
ncbi:MAG: hypothetical protein ACRD3T_13905 [Terriglobia bacterium]